MLPPDNFQEEPMPVVAHRTSPTNLGLYLLSVAAARDFGWIGTLDTVERLEATLESMNGLERFRGHFYNWYGTLDLRPLEPKYISSVDSGNLAGHLIALWNACAEMAKRPVIECAMACRDRRCARPDARVPARGCRRSRSDDSQAVWTTRSTVSPPCFDMPPQRRSDIAATIEGACAPRQESRRHRANADRRNTAITPAPAPKRRVWADAIGASVRSHQRDLELLMPWAALIARDPALAAPDDELAPLLAAMPTLADLPDLCEAAIAILTRRRHGRAPQSARTARPKFDALIDGFNRSANAAAAFEGRLAALGEIARKMFDGDGRSTFSSIRSASCCRSDIGSPTGVSTPITTTCSPPRRVSRASSRSPRATCPPATGSGSDAPWRQSGTVPR